MTKITEVEGIGEIYAHKLAEVGITTQEQLLEGCSERAGRRKLIDDSGIGPTLIMKWANRADLSRVKGVGGQYADLLECAGVDTVPELALRNAGNLFAKMTEVNDTKGLVRKLPTESQVINWVTQAKSLPRKICY